MSNDLNHSLRSIIDRLSLHMGSAANEAAWDDEAVDMVRQLKDLISAAKPVAYVDRVVDCEGDGTIIGVVAAAGAKVPAVGDALFSVPASEPTAAVPQGCDGCGKTGIRQNDEGRNVFCPDCDLGRAYAGVHLAQEPVGEIVAGKEIFDGERWVPTVAALLNRKGKVGDKLYTAPPAQAVDLGQFREPIAAWSKHCAHSIKGYESYQDRDLPDWMAERRQQVRKCGELLALIDKAVQP